MTESDRTNSMTSLATIALGLGFFGLFFSMIAACNRL